MKITVSSIEKMFSFLAAMAFGCCCYAEYIVETGGKLTLSVDRSSETVISEQIRLSPRSTVEKTGEGKLTLSTGSFVEQEDIAIGVAEGSLEVKATDSDLTEYTKPTEVMNTAAFWLDSTVNLVTNGAKEVEAWYDVRETADNIKAHSFEYTRAVPFLREQKLTAKPLAQSYKEKDGVYFRGYGSGCFMNWYTKDGSQENIGNICHVYVVHGGPTSRGHVLGQRKGNNPYFQREDKIWYAHSAENIGIHNSRSYLNGVQVDPHTQNYPANSINIIEVEALNQKLKAMCFFNDRDMQLTTTGGTIEKNTEGKSINAILGTTEQTGGGDRAGGEYIFEVLIFTNSLTTAERLDICNYLRQKWLDATPPGANHKAIVSLSSNSTLQFSGESPSENLSIVGDGTVVASGPARLRSVIETRHGNLGFNIASGTFNLLYQLPYKATAGETIDVASTYYGPVYSVTPTSGASDTFVKTGAGALTLNKIPEGVTKLKVTSGSLTLAAPEKELKIFPKPVDVYSVAIPDSTFEGLHDRGTDPYNWKGNGSTFGANGAWHAIVPATTPGKDDSGVMIFDQRMGSPGGWNMAMQGVPTTVLVLKNQASAWCEIEVERDGVYRLSFDAAPRGEWFTGEQLNIMIGKDESHLQSVGYFKTFDKVWRTYIYDNIYLTSGRYQFWLKNKLKDDDRCTQFDNFKLELVPARREWLIPNGDLEYCNPSISSDKVYGFTLTQATDVGNSYTADYEVNYTNTTFVKKGTLEDKFFNRPWNRNDSEYQLYIAGTGAKVETEFYPPAGSWHLAADVGLRKLSNHSQGNYVLKATIDFGEGAISLGAITNSSLAMLQREWPVAFTSDGKTKAKITIESEVGLWQQRGQANIDNIVLVSTVGSGKNLFANPGFEKMEGYNWTKSWMREITPKPNNVSATELRPYDSYYNQHFGIDEFEGTNCIKLVNDDSVYQTITFNEGGLYRFSANFESRCAVTANSTSFGHGDNPIRFYVAKGGETNWLGITDGAQLTNFVETAVVFRVPEGGGTYDVGIRGSKVWPGGGSGVDETTMVDGMQLYKIETEDSMVLPEDLEIELSEGAKLTLDFDGTKVISLLKIDGRSCSSGTITAENTPELNGRIFGRGALQIVPRFFTVNVR